MDGGLLSIISAGSLLLKLMVHLDQILYTYLFLHCPDTGMQNGDEALPRRGVARDFIMLKPTKQTEN